MDKLVNAEAKLRFSPLILQRLGEELNPSVDQGIIELVKNSYDADASRCDVWLDGEDGHDSVVIEDNGTGMDADAILRGWLVLGGSSKSTNTLTKAGRRPAGNKGLGRLAALRLGRIAHMSSRPGNGFEYSITIDWDLFSGVEAVDDVALSVTQFPSTDPPGTRIELRGLRTTIGRVDARRLARALVLLADPFTDGSGGFEPVLHTETFSDLAGQVTNRYFDQAEYHLVAEIKDGQPEATVRDWRGEILWTAAPSDFNRATGDGAYGVPDTRFELWVYILNHQSFQTRSVQLSAVREWLGTFGGVHVYVNGLRVAPYGNPSNDWLDMNLARARSPEERPSTNTSIGRVLVEDPNDSLRQKTDRSGFLDTWEFSELQRFAKDAMNWMAQKRVETAERKRRAARAETQKDASKSSETVNELIRQVTDDASKAALQLSFKTYERERDREAEVLRREVQLYRTLSTAGITAATFAHEAQGNPLKAIGTSLTGIASRLVRNPSVNFEADYAQAISRIRAATLALSVLSTATLELIDADKRRMGKVVLNQTVRDITQTFKPFLDGRNVQLTVVIPEGSEPFLQGSAASVESIITNLINNSLAAFETSTNSDRMIHMTVSTTDELWCLEVADSGPGIVGIGLEEIWLPGHTLKPHGTGLGLTIVKDTVADLGGNVKAIANGSLGGAVFTLQLPTLGAD